MEICNNLGGSGSKKNVVVVVVVGHGAVSARGVFCVFSFSVCYFFIILRSSCILKPLTVLPSFTALQEFRLALPLYMSLISQLIKISQISLFEQPVAPVHDCRNLGEVTNIRFLHESR